MSVTIVVVDDDSVDRYLVNRLAQELEVDCKVVEYNAGDTFLAAFADDDKREAEIGSPPPPILVLLDINMPRMNGFQVLEKLESIITDPERVVVFTMYSSSSRAEERKDALSYKTVKDFVVKPITAERLDEIVHKYCLQS